MRLAVTLVALAVLPHVLHAQANWDKSYNVSSKPSMQIEVDDAGVRVHGCGGCRAVRIHVDWRGNDPSRWRMTEMQAGSGIHFALKHRQEHTWMGGGWHGHSPEVAIETPSETDLNVRAGDGGVSVAGLRGSLTVKTGDGSIQMDESSGALRVSTGDGSVAVRRAEGSLFAETGDGSMTLEGRLTQIEAHTGDGSVNVTLLPGSALQSSSRITTGDGSIAMRVPGDLRADVDASTGDGSIRSDLPLGNATTQRTHVHGAMNGGGPVLRLHSGDGSITLARN